MKKEFSAGGIVFNDQNQVLLICSSQGGFWGFPKGHIDGQASKEAALREVKEEGGIEAEIIDEVGKSQYVVTNPTTQEQADKEVTYYLMKYLSGNTDHHDGEIAEAKWFSKEEALKIISFPVNKELLNKAMEMWNGRK
jgi:tRNA nucleotidyltransferase (CCA-adding enzyme)